MKLSVIAVDFDGTIARDDALDAAVRQAIADARARRIMVAIVTGRRLDDLRGAAGDLHVVDAVVAENGAVLHFPATGYTSVLAAPPPPTLLDELTARNIPHTAGQCLVEAAAADAPAILDAIRTRELPLVLIFNRSRLMLMPQSVTKATGLREALAIARLSPHSAVAIGDAENDHELLRGCEVGVAVSWGSESLRAAADVVIDGDGPPAVAAFIAALARTGQLPDVRVQRRRLLLGHTDDGSPFTLAVQGRNVLVAGDARSGKSWVAGLLAEQLILQRYSVCVIDPEGDYRPLEHLPGVVVHGGSDPLPRPRELLRALRHAETSVVLDLSRLAHHDKVDYVRALLPALVTLRQRTGLPHRIVLDEAHYFLTAESIPAMIDLDQNGYTLATYRASHLPDAILRASEVVIVTSESDPGEVAALHAACSRNGTDSIEDWIAVLGALGIGEAAALPVTEEAGDALRRIHLAPRLTHHVRHREKYVDIPVPESRGFVFTRRGRLTGTCARTLREFVLALEREHPGSLDAHLRARDFSRWLRDVFGDYPLAAAVGEYEERCCTEQYPDAVAAIASTIRVRYDLADERILEAGVGARSGNGPRPAGTRGRTPAAGGR